MDSNNMIKVSVIIPVYNSEEYVADAIKSVLSQNLDGFELILVDDGSTDGSGAICDDFAELDSRVRVLHITNGGMCHARNIALDMAHGEYVTFCDNDDECLPGFLSENYELAKKYDADVVRFGRRCELIVDGMKAPEVSDNVPIKMAAYSDNDVYLHFDEIYGSYGVWTGLYRRSMLDRNGLRFNEALRRGCEDKIFNLDVYDFAQTVCLNPKVHYVWRRRVMHSSSMSFDDNYYLGMGLYIHRLRIFMKDHNLTELNLDLCAREMLAPFREMVGARARSGEASFASDLEFCAKVRTIYDGYWDSSYVNLKVPQSVVLDWIMCGRYLTAALVVYGWRLRTNLGG